MPVGFILHPTYYLEPGREGTAPRRRPVVHLFGRLDSGETFVLRDDRARPHFYLRTAELPAALGLTPLTYRDAGLTTPEGEPVSRVTVEIPTDVPPLRDRLESSGVRTYEADIPFVTSWLIAAGVRGALRIEGEGRPGRRVGRIFQNAPVGPAHWAPELDVLSLDIETDPDASRALSAALWSERASEVLVVQPPDGAGVPAGILMPERAVPVRVCADEAALLAALAERIRAIDPDVITGWNVIDFDLRVLQDRFLAHRLPFELGRADLPCRLLLDRSTWGASRAIVPGRAVLDALALARASFVRLEDYRLETAAREILGEGKAISSEDRGEEILRLYREDPTAFLRYNLNDARLVDAILRRKKLVPLCVRQSLLTGMPPDRTGASIASFDFLYLSELHRRGQVAPTTRADRPVAFTQGGFVLASRPGIYDSVAVLDYRSLYPSIIRTFRLDPLSLLPAEDPVEGEPPIEIATVTAPNGARFRRLGGILPELLDRLFPERERALAAGDPLAATAIKILMNSFYGVLATPRCRFYSPETANAITGFGQQILLWTKDEIEARGRRVLYGDTDSIFVELPPEAEPAEEGRRLAEEITRELASRLQRVHGVESRCALRCDRIFRRLLLPALRGSTEGSKKRYAGLVREGEHDRLVVVGLEIVRRDWTDLSKRFQRELIERAFRGEPVEDFVRDFLARFRRGEMDDLLVYRKGLRKPDADYEGTPPAHVRAARLRSRPGGKIVRYLMTTAGPEPEGELRHPIDREHYLEKQLRPVAESILALLDRSWEELTGGQASLPF